jgi:hypothetical protein
MALNSTKTVDKYRLHGIGSADRAVYLGYKALAQKSGAKADDTGGIVTVALKSCNLWTG